MEQAPIVVQASRLPASSKASNNRGVALMLVLLLVVLLGAIAFEYAYETQVEASLAANGRADTEAYIAAKSAVALGMSMLQGDQLQGIYGTDPNNPIVPNPQNPQNPQDPQGMFGEYDSKWTDMWGQPVAQPINNATMHCNIEDECGKLNLNMFADLSTERNNPTDPQPQPPNPENPDQQPPAQPEDRALALENVLRNLFDQMEADPNPTDAILDWLDSDDEPRPEGAESDFYEALETPYACKNGPMESIEELLLIAGVTPEIYFDLNRTPEETAELQAEFGENGLYPVSSLPDLLTAVGSIEGKINFNTARPELLLAFVQDPAIVESIVTKQMETPFQDAQEIATYIDLPPELKDLADVKSNVFRIQGDGFVDDVMVRIEAYVVRPDPYSEIPMPFRILSWRVIR